MNFHKQSKLTTEERQALENYFKEKLPQYEIDRIYPKSNHPEDAFLHMVSAKHKTSHTYAVWTCWNTRINSLNHGHYDLPDERVRDIVFSQYFYDAYA